MRILQALFLVYTINVASFGQAPANPLSLAEAIAWGVEHNLGVAGQRLNVQVAATNNNWVSAGRAPVVQATIGVNNSLNAQDNPASFINGTFYTGNATAGLQANYTLFNGYRVRFSKRQLGQLETVANQQLRQLLETSVYDVALAYYDAQLATAREKLEVEGLQLSSDLAEFQELRRSYGQGKSVDVLQARTVYLVDSIAVARATINVENSVRNLYLAMDADQHEFQGRLISDTLAYEANDWEIAAIERQIDSSAAIQLLKTQESLALTNTELARSAMKPSIALSAGLSHTRNAFKLNGEDPRTGEDAELVFGSTGQGLLGLSAAYTLWDAGARKRAINNAIVNERVANVNLRNAKQEASLQAQNLIATYKNQRQLLSLQDELIRNAKANLRLAEEQLKAGAINSFDYRDLQLSYLDAEQARLDAVYAILVTDLNLRRLTGSLLN